MARNPGLNTVYTEGVQRELDALGRTPGNVYYVNSGAANKSDSNAGDTWDKPLATIDAAIGKCTANQGDIIFVAPGHAETISAAAGIDADIAGITIIGLGQAEARPVLTFGTAAGADMDIDAANIAVRNIVFKNDIDSQTAMIDVNAAGFTMEDCDLLEGSAKQALIYIDLAEDRATIRRCYIKSITAGANSGIKIAAAKDRIRIEDCTIDGDFADAGIHNPTGNVATNLVLRNNLVRNRQTGDHAIELVSACTGEAIGNRLFADTPGVVFDPGSLFCADNYEAYKVDSAAVVSPAGNSGPWQMVHAAKATATLPASTTQAIFTVAGGRCLVHLLLGEVTTVVQAQACNLKVTSNPTTGTDVDLAANLDINSDEAGTLYLVEGDGTALVGANAGAALNGVGQGAFIVPVGTIQIETSATNTGATKWDVWYTPLDVGARIVSA